MSSAGDTELYRFLRAVAGAQPDPEYLRVPKCAGRYRVGERLGQGGLGLVHAGWDPQLGRAVAIKFVRLDRTGGEPGRRMQERLRTEAQALARLAHPHVVPVFDVGDAGGQVFVAMQRIEGITLRRWLALQPSLARTLAVFEAAGSGLAAAHEVGVVHRDFKPDNVLVDEGDHAWVVDFGLAQEVGTVTEETMTDGSGGSETRGVLGTHGYLAPELLDGEPPAPHSDQFAFCQTLRGVVHSDSPSWLKAIVDRGLEPDPRRRFVSMRALIDAMHRGGERRSWRIAGGLVGVAILGIGMAAAIPSRRVTPHEDDQKIEARSSAEAAANLARGREAEASDDPDADVYLQAAFFEGREAADDAVAGEAATRLAVVELQRSRLAGAKYWIEHAKALRGDDPDVGVIAAAIKVYDGQAGDALRELQASLDEGASDDALIVAGQAAVKVEQPALAKQYFERAGGETALFHLVDLELELGELDAAQEHLRQAFALEGETAAGPSAAVWRMEMGNLLRQQGKLDEALVYLDQAAAMLAGLDHPDEAVIEEARGLVHEMKGDTVRARAAYERALVIREAAVGRDHEFTAYTLLRLTSVADDPDQSLAYALEARAILKRTLGPESAVVAATHAAAAEINMNRGRFDEALADAERAVELYSKSERLPDELARAKLLLADLLWRDPQARVRAHGLAEEAEAFLAASWAGNAPYLEAARAWLREHPTPR